ncbi:phage baseplate assembly protein V [Xylella fastidiosa]|uniref:phage baseplate assembly protein V n=1 Tax=Xylella fastidiosa TaxID=2371 RepID=UPI001FB9D578|nr:phage baseplate assembly protein V [Xylella fastidiosa]
MRQTLNEHTRQLAHLILQGTVAELDPATACVRIEAGELLTDWLPVMASRAGADRSWWLPHLGEQVIALCPNGDSALGIVLLGLAASTKRPSLRPATPPTSPACCLATEHASPTTAKPTP